MPKVPSQRDVDLAPASFITVVRRAMAQEGLSLNQAAYQAGLSPAFLSRILNRQRGLPSDEALLRLAAVLNLAPRERLLIEAGRIPQSLQAVFRHPQMPALLRATGGLSEEDMQQVVKTVQALALKRHRSKTRP